MRCEYCGRTNHDDGHGACFACGAPVTYTVHKRSYGGSVYESVSMGCYATCVPFSHPAFQYEKERD